MLRLVRTGGGTPADKLPPTRAVAHEASPPAAPTWPEKPANPGSAAELTGCAGARAAMPAHPHAGWGIAVAAPTTRAAAAAS